VPAIAEGLGIPVNTAYSRLRLAREDLAAAYKKLGAAAARTGKTSAINKTRGAW
ncbi:MAG: hypothetical protein JOZ69_22270, partial [Myxococcales bacterium]|nr:hypothetical protein [Myxococcales bacterium]